MIETGLPILSALVLLPLIGAFFTLMIRGDDQERLAINSRLTALSTSIVTFLVSLSLWGGFDVEGPYFQFNEAYEWLPALGIRYHVGIDGISLFFVLLSTLLTPLCILASWDSIKNRVRDYMIAFLVLEAMMIGMFVSLDTFLFYIFFEGILIPMFIIIGVWGGPNRVYASFKFFLYTLLGSVLMLIALIAIYLQTGTSDIPTLFQTSLPATLQTWVWWAFFASFAVKVPMWPVHTWLPDAHVEAPTAGSVILAGVLLKMGGYGFLRFSLPMAPLATQEFAWVIMGLSVIAIIYTSLVALVQQDMKKLIAYSSVAHMGFVTLGIFSLNKQGIEGSIFQMLSHGIVSAALFLCVGVVYDRLHTRDIGRYGGVVKVMPKYALFFMIFMLASVGLPGTSGFVGEFLTILGAYQANAMVATFATTGIILGAAYMLYLYRAVIFGPLTKKDVKAMPDLSVREVLIFAPLIAIVFWMGIYPQPIFDVMSPAVDRVLDIYQTAITPAGDVL